MADEGVNAYSGYHRVRVKGRLVYLQLLHHYRDREEIAKRVLSVSRHQLGFQAQRVRVQQSIHPAMTDKKAVYVHFQRQVLFALIGTVQHHRRVVERRQVDVPQVNVHIRLLVG